MSRQNLCPNPACGTNSTGWSSSSTLTRTTGITGMPVSTGVMLTGGIGFVRPSTGVVAPGDVMTVSFYVKNNSAGFVFAKTVFVGYTRSAGGDTFPETFMVVPGAVGDVVRGSFTCAAAPALATGIYLIIDNFDGASGSGFQFSAVLFEKVGSLDTYFDGNSPGASWDGTTNNSTSTLADAGVSPTGLAVPLTLGSPTVALGINPQPSGLAIPISFGNPTVTTPAQPEPAPTTANRGGWFGLLAIAQEAREMRREDRARQPIECPHDGQPLDMNAEGVLHCPYDGWTWNGSEVL